ncbi:ARM repeat-containing protein [Polyplosphaeria fusca]|uniref:ARM repeat-containing protein n=1 Tax=Polyplosphaeria fusca TaxID=682080 RepID=A0A9P4QPY3_9PLEO|nr:ARM repeat-containing protein [Polyplosphaeria fusca]
MSLNITSEGSPTPRKNPTRFSMAEELRVDTSPEALGTAVGFRHPVSWATPQSTTSHRPLQSSLTSLQGVKRPSITHDGAVPLSTSTRSNQAMLVPSQAFSKTLDSIYTQDRSINPTNKDYDSSSTESVPITPATAEFTVTPTTEPDTNGVVVNAGELLKLKQELEDARNEVARMNQELHTTHLTKSTLDHAIGQPSEPAYNYYKGEVSEQTISQLQNKFNASTRPSFGRQESWPQDDNLSEKSYGPIPSQSRPVTAHSQYRGRNYLNEPTHFPLDQSYRNNVSSNPPSRPGSAFDSRLHFPGFNNPVVVAPYQARSAGGIGTRLSPEAAEFSVESMTPTPWNVQQLANESGMQYVAPVEPMNYRRLLDRNMNCNWKYIVDKIICSNDQQASIFLQQKLKVGTVEQKFEIVEAIIAQAYPLMINRFGNFLVQRCFEHGTPEQVVSIAQAIRGNTLTLSMDAFGCHVIQKAFDAVPEEYKATMVHELLRRIPDTIIHRYACHVWQKLFELRWADSPPQIMRYVNEALRGMWHEVALGETGSLVVQNIFENCLEEDKRPCVNEVLASIDVIAHGQFGNWCIQHVCEHGAPADRGRAIEHIIHFASEYSMDQYASKVIEKCLKIGGADFLDRYLDRVCEDRADRPRTPLIDIAGDQFGNYLIQWILTNASPTHRELVGSHVRKHMVSLRGSKYGSRVAMLCCNPALTTRPGPPAGMQINRYSTHNLHRGGGYGGFR